MCGITGAFSKNGISLSDLQLANGRLSHRGPDAEGYYVDATNKFFLGHRRLSILDLSDLANQPMHSACGRYVIAYNGEVYNFRELKAKLPGFSWRTHGDTEVILELFAEFGASSFELLNGMFSLLIFDKVEEKLFIARDQAGIKPLFYYQDESRVVFASELKAVRTYLESVNLPVLINREAVPSFLHLGFIPEPATIYQNVYKFPAAHYAVLSDDSAQLKLSRYWDPKEYFLTDPIQTEDHALKQYKEILVHAVEGQMLSDVPLGTFLSGGIDSSLVTAVAASLSPVKVNSFSIGFHEAAYDESVHAAAVARHLGTEHHEFKVSAEDVLELISLLPEVYDEPFADSSAFPTMLVSKLARQKVTVALSGDGGDELFQGYGMYTWANRLANPLVGMAGKSLYHASKLMPDRYQRAGRLFNYPSKGHLHTHIFSQEQYYFSEKELNELLVTPPFSMNFAEINKSTVTPNSTPADSQAFWDFEHYLKDDLLVKVDRAAMHYSLETRVPLLDTRLVEFALNLDYNLKVKPGYGRKYLMKKTLFELVPRDLFERPKRGFSIPLKTWLKGPLAWMIEEYLNRDVIEKQGFVQHDQVKNLITQFRAGQDHLYNRIWVLIVLHWWLEKSPVSIVTKTPVTHN